MALKFRKIICDRQTCGRLKFADWVLSLGKRSGVYVIRNMSRKNILYVGESHTGRLSATLRRHFHAWRDEPERKHFTYEPHKVEVAAFPCPPVSAVSAQNNLIRRLKPRDNTNGFTEKNPF